MRNFQFMFSFHFSPFLQSIDFEVVICGLLYGLANNFFRDKSFKSIYIFWVYNGCMSVNCFGFMYAAHCSVFECDAMQRDCFR